eukprot:1477515-Rhodomonas_salina.1
MPKKTPKGNFKAPFTCEGECTQTMLVAKGAVKRAGCEQRRAVRKSCNFGLRSSSKTHRDASATEHNRSTLHDTDGTACATLATTTAFKTDTTSLGRLWKRGFQRSSWVSDQDFGEHLSDIQALDLVVVVVVVVG